MPRYSQALLYVSFLDRVSERQWRAGVKRVGPTVTTYWDPGEVS